MAAFKPTTLVSIIILSVLFSCKAKKEPAHPVAKAEAQPVWWAPDTATIPHDEQGNLIRYGRELIAHTAYYLGPKGRVASMTNGMNCQNCHLDAGTKPWGNNYGRIHSSYPMFRARSHSLETIEKRVNDCLQRSLNGKTLDSTSREMRAIVSYMHWLGKDVPKGTIPHGTGIKELAFLERAADPEKGRVVYDEQCGRCHGTDGAGVFNPDGITYQYPPLWGENSYTTAAGMYRLIKISGYVKANMPFDSVSYGRQLKDEEAWDVGAFVNSQPRPVRKFKEDWPDISLKPIDHPFGPFSDSFPEQQHKYGPFGPIKKAREKSGQGITRHNGSSNNKSP